jgi:hypothetical protein
MKLTKKKLGLAKKKNKKDVLKEKWIGYERIHSLTEVHIYWNQEGICR